jgi:ribosomal protein L14
MIILRSIINVVDNSGILKVRCFHVIGLKVGTVGSRRIGSVKKIDKGSTWERGDVVRGLLVRVSKEYQRKTGMVMKGSMNGMVGMNKKWEPLGTRVTVTLPKELRILGYMKVIVLANMVM